MANYNDHDRAGELARRRAIDTAFIFKANGHECNDNGRCLDCEDTDVRIRMVPDEFCDIEDLMGDVYDYKANPEIDPEVLDEQRADFIASVERFGVWGLIAEYKDDAGVWCHADSIFGLCDDDAVGLYTAEFKRLLIEYVQETPSEWLAL